MRHLYFVLFFMLLIGQNLHSESIQNLTYALTCFNNDDSYDEKMDTAKMLQKIDPFNEIAIDFIVRYYFDRKIDSISIFFDKLMSDYPQDPKPILLRADHVSEEFLSYIDSCNIDSLCRLKKEMFLKRALTLDSINVEANTRLSQLYYQDFIRPTEIDSSIYKLNIKLQIPLIVEEDSCYKERLRLSKVSIFENSARKALQYLVKTQELINDSGFLLYFPIKQLEYYLFKSSPPTLDSLEHYINAPFLPPWYFANLSTNWFKDLSVDYLNLLDNSIRTVNALKFDLDSFGEVYINKCNIPNNHEIYRFIWLRSFKPPILIRLEREGKLIQLFWKSFDNEICYNVNDKKTISYSCYRSFIKKLSATGFEKLPNQTYLPMPDGESLILEKRTSTYYKVHDTNFPDENFEDCCMYLLRLTGMNTEPIRINN